MLRFREPRRARTSRVSGCLAVLVGLIVLDVLLQSYLSTRTPSEASLRAAPARPQRRSEPELAGRPLVPLIPPQPAVAGVTAAGIGVHGLASDGTASRASELGLDSLAALGALEDAAFFAQEETHGLVLTSLSQTVYEVKLSSQPQVDVAVTLTDLDGCFADIMPSGLVFTPANWADDRKVILRLARSPHDCTSARVLHELYSTDTLYDGLYVRATPLNGFEAVTHEDKPASASGPAPPEKPTAQATAGPGLRRSAADLGVAEPPIQKAVSAVEGRVADRGGAQGPAMAQRSAPATPFASGAAESLVLDQESDPMLAAGQKSLRKPEPAQQETSSDSASTTPLELDLRLDLSEESPSFETDSAGIKLERKAPPPSQGTATQAVRVSGQPGDYRGVPAIESLESDISQLLDEYHCHESKLPNKALKCTLGKHSPFATHFYIVSAADLIGQPAKPAPLTMVVGGVHGRELAGFEAAGIMKTWTPANGRMLIIDKLNKRGVEKHTRYVPAVSQHSSHHGKGSDGAQEATNRTRDDLNRDLPADLSQPPLTPLAQAVWDLCTKVRPKLFIDCHEGWGFYKQSNLTKNELSKQELVGNHKFSKGSTVIASANALGVAQLMVDTVNAQVKEKLHKFEVLSPPIDGGLARRLYEAFQTQSVVLETTQLNQALEKRVGQQLAMTSALLKKIGMLAPDFTVGKIKFKRPSHAQAPERPQAMANAAVPAGSVGGDKTATSKGKSSHSSHGHGGHSSHSQHSSHGSHGAGHGGHAAPPVVSEKK